MPGLKFQQARNTPSPLRAPRGLPVGFLLSTPHHPPPCSDFPGRLRLLLHSPGPGLSVRDAGADQRGTSCLGKHLRLSLVPASTSMFRHRQLQGSEAAGSPLAPLLAPRPRVWRRQVEVSSRIFPVGAFNTVTHTYQVNSQSHSQKLVSW